MDSTFRALREICRAEEGVPRNLLDEVVEADRIQCALDPARAIAKRREIAERAGVLRRTYDDREARWATGQQTVVDEIMHMLVAARCQHCGYITKDRNARPKAKGSCRWCFERLGGH